MKKSIYALLASLCGCAGAPVEVPVPIPVTCEVPEPQRPAYAFDAATKAMPPAEKIRRLRAEIRQREFYEEELRTALAACR
jgi:hypothetical protein